MLLSCGYVNVSFFQSVVQSGTMPQLREMLLYDMCVKISSVLSSSKITDD